MEMGQKCWPHENQGWSVQEELIVIHSTEYCNEENENKMKKMKMKEQKT